MPSPAATSAPNRSSAAFLHSPGFAVLVAFGLRIILLFLSHYHEDRAHPRFETVGLEARMIAFSLAEGKGFSNPFPGYDLSTAWIAPVYPFLWAIGIRMFRLNAFGATLFAQVMNCAFSAATCWPIFAIGKRIFGERTGLASAWLWVFLPYAVLFPLEWTWDQSLGALMLALVVAATLALRESSTAVAWTGYGLLWALSALVNPTLCVLLPFFLLWLTARRKISAWRNVALAARAAGVFVLALLPWTIRNYYAVDGWVFVKSNFGLELWLGNNPAVKDVYTPEFHPASNSGQRISLVFAGEPNYNRAKQRQALTYIAGNPRTFLKNSTGRFVDTWAATYDSRVDPWILALRLSCADVWFSAAFSLLSFAGLLLAIRTNWADSLPLAICLLVFPIPYYLTHTAMRYRSPIDPLMAILAAFAASRILKFFSRQPQPMPAAPNV